MAGEGTAWPHGAGAEYRRNRLSIGIARPFERRGDLYQRAERIAHEAGYLAVRFTLGLSQRRASGRDSMTKRGRHVVEDQAQLDVPKLALASMNARVKPKAR